MIPDDLREQNAMLASPCKTPNEFVETADPRYIYDIKWDGVRCLAYVDDGVVTLVNRNHVDITGRYPDVAAALAELFPTGQRVFDGEMLVFGEDGRPSFYGISKRDHDMSPLKTKLAVESFPATYVIFDFLYFDGDDLRNMPYRGRRALLRTSPVTSDFVQITESSPDAAMMWEFVREHRLEGLIAKDGASRYDGRRSSSWIKLKPTRTLSAVVTRYEHGKVGGHREHRIGALFLDLYDATGQLVEVGKVGTGLTDVDLADLKARLDAGEVLVADVEFQNVTDAGALRFPSWRGIRTDLSAIECTMTQLELAPRPEEPPGAMHDDEAEYDDAYDD